MCVLQKVRLCFPDTNQSLEVARGFLVELVVSPGPLAGRPALPPLDVLLVESLRPAVLGLLPAGHQAGQSDASPGGVGNVGSACK